MGLSATPNATAKDLGAMLLAGNTAAANKTQASSSGTDTFDNLLSDRAVQDAARRRADAQSIADDTGHRANVARKDAMCINATSNDQDTKPTDGNMPMPSITTPAASTVDTVIAEQSQPASAKDLDIVAKQAAVDLATQLAAQIEAARQAAQQAAAAQLPVTLPAAPSISNTDTNAASSTASKSPASGAIALAAASAVANGTQDSADPAAMTQAGLAGLPATRGAKVNATDTPTPSVTALPNSGTLAQAIARVHAITDNTPTVARQLGSASSGQGANADHDLPRRDLSPYNAPAQPAVAAITDAISHASNGGNIDDTDNVGTQSNAQGNGMQFQGVLLCATGDGGMAAPTFAVGGANADVTAEASITPQRVHMPPTFGGAAWP